MKKNTLDLLKALIAAPSVTPEDCGCQDLVAAYIYNSGLEIKIRQENINGVKNLWLTHGSGAPLIVFAGHTDVVPSGNPNDWTNPPFEPTERDGYLYGRGASDMKGGVATMASAFRSLIESNPNHKGTLALLLTSDEEGEALFGTKAMLELLDAEGVKIDYAIVGEPSSSKVLGDFARCGRRGSYGVTLTIEGKQGHVAYPEQVINPIHIASKIIAAASSVVWDAANEYFPATSFQVSNFQAGTGATNVVPQTATVQFNWRFNTEQNYQTLRTKMEALIAENIGAASYKYEETSKNNAFLTENETLKSALSEAIWEVCQEKVKFNCAGGTSDARFFALYDCAVLEFGSENSTIHQIDERVKIADLEHLPQVYIKTVEKLWAQDKS